MDIDYSVFFLFCFHFIIFLIDIWALYKIFKVLIFIEAPTTEKYMLVFKPFEIALILLISIVVISETHYMINFFNEIDLYYYELVSLTAQGFFIFLTIRYITKEI